MLAPFQPGVQSIKVPNFTNPINNTHPLNERCIFRYDMRFYHRPHGGGGTYCHNLMGGRYPYMATVNKFLANTYFNITTDDVRPGGGAVLFAEWDRTFGGLELLPPSGSGTEEGNLFLPVYNFTVSYWHKVYRVQGFGGIFEFCDWYTTPTANTGVNHYNHTNSTTVWQPQHTVRNYWSAVLGNNQTNFTNQSWSLPMTEWVHMTWVNAQFSQQCYINGELAAITAGGPLYMGQWKHIGVANYYATPASKCEFKFDDFRWFNTQLTAEQAKQLYETSSAQYDPTLNWIEVGPNEHEMWGYPQSVGDGRGIKNKIRIGI